MSAPSHLFIVGASRSGTSLLRSCLDTSDQIALTGETHFLGGIRSTSSVLQYLSHARPINDFDPVAPLSCANLAKKLAKKGDARTDQGAESIVDFLCNPSHPFWNHAIQEFDKVAMLKKLLASDRSHRALFDLIMETYAGETAIRGEKTPAHIHAVPTLLKWFPDARIIHILRDPRAVFLSQRRKKAKQRGDKITLRHRIIRKSNAAHELYIATNVMCHWLRIAQLDEMYQCEYPDRYTRVKFESIISQPEQSLEGLCSFLGVDYTPEMSTPAFSNSSITGKSYKQPEEQRVSGFDTAAIKRWQEHIDPRTRKWIERSARKYIEKFGYA